MGPRTEAVLGLVFAAVRFEVFFLPADSRFQLVETMAERVAESYGAEWPALASA